MTDDCIKSLTEAHGHTGLDDSTLRAVRQTIEGAYIDDVLDGKGELSSLPQTNPQGS